MPFLKKYFVLLVIFMSASFFAGCSDEPDTTTPFLALDQATKDWIAVPTRSPELELSGTVSEGATIEVAVSPLPAHDLVSLGPVEITDTTWKYPLNNLDQAGDRTYAVSVTAINALGNRSTLFLNFTIDTISPEVSIDQFTDPVQETGRTIAGTLETGSTLEIFVNGSVMEDVFVNVTTWEFLLPELEVEEYVIIARATDAAGNISEDETIVLGVVEGALPLVVEAESPTNSREQTVLIETIEDAAVVVELNRGETDPETGDLIFSPIDAVDGSREYLLDALATGKNILRVSASFEEQTAVAQVMIFVDETRPRIVSMEPLGDAVALPTTITATFSEGILASTINEATFTVSEGEEPVTGVVGYDPAEKKATFTTDQLLPGKTYTVMSTHEAVTDLAGNFLLEHATWIFTIPPPDEA